METNRKIQFTKIRDVKSPNRANLNDAGMDFYIPNYSEEFLNDLKAKNTANNLQYILDGEDGENTNYTLTNPTSFYPAGRTKKLISK